MKIFSKVVPIKSVPLDQAFERYYPAIFRNFRYRGADADTANDLSSSTFERALMAIEYYEARKSQIQIWLFEIEPFI